jgi:hypothetical protein
VLPVVDGGAAAGALPVAAATSLATFATPSRTEPSRIVELPVDDESAVEVPLRLGGEAGHCALPFDTAPVLGSIVPASGDAGLSHCAGLKLPSPVSMIAYMHEL